MAAIGILGGMGPAATVDFLGKLVDLTPASRDQEHLPVLLASVPHAPDRSAAILGDGPDPLPSLLKGIAALNRGEVGLIVVPCNSSHHWYEQMSAASQAPLLHIAQASVAAAPEDMRTLLLATRGALRSGFYQRAFDSRGLSWELPATPEEQQAVDESIRLVKGGRIEAAGEHLAVALRAAATRGTGAALLACTELPIAARKAGDHGLILIDSSLELARAAVAYAIQRGWQAA